MVPVSGSVQNIVNYTEDKHLIQRVAQDQEVEVASKLCFWGGGGGCLKRGCMQPFSQQHRELKMYMEGSPINVYNDAFLEDLIFY